MGFTTPCFIRKNTPELRKKLGELGYKKNSPNWTDDCNIIWTYQYPVKGFDTPPNYVIDDSYSYFRIGTNAFTDKSEALKKAEEMKIRKIASLRKQIEKLEKLSFKVEEKQQ